jgi:hypothetical protein
MITDDDRDAFLVAEAKEIADRIMAPWRSGVGEDPPEITDQERLAIGFAVLVRRMLEPETRPLLHRCGWCVAAVGDDDAAWQSAEDFDLAGIKAHTLKCPHNPLVKELTELRAEVRR